MQEYIITVKDPQSWNTLWSELINLHSNAEYVPNRSVDVLNERPFNDYCAHFNLTADEALLLKQDPRVLDVELDIQLDSSISISKCAKRPEIFNYPTYPSERFDKNWALIDCTRGLDYAAVTGWNDYTYQLDGEGVDIIIIDEGIAKDHPEFALNIDGSGGSRVIDFDWYSLGVPGVPPSSNFTYGYLYPLGDHGTASASIAAGNTQGWASKAKIYCIKISFGSSSSGINVSLVFDLVRAFHLQKIANGNKRPTICSCSWGAVAQFPLNTPFWINSNNTWHQVTNPWSGYSDNYGIFQRTYLRRVTNIDTSVENCASAGVILVGSAGNEPWRAYKPDSNMYNNFWNTTQSTSVYDPGSKATIDIHLTSGYHYNRGTSPGASNSMIYVGSCGSHHDGSNASHIEFRDAESYSARGPRLDVFAPGKNIMAACWGRGVITDTRNSDYSFFRFNGTSAAAPQVAGIIACMMQSRPDSSIQDIKRWLSDGQTVSWKKVYDYTGTKKCVAFQNNWHRPVKGSIDSKPSE